MALDSADSAVGKTMPDPMAAPADDEPLLETASRRLREPAHRRWLGCTFGVILILAGTPHALPKLLTRSTFIFRTTSLRVSHAWRQKPV